MKLSFAALFLSVITTAPSVSGAPGLTKGGKSNKKGKSSKSSKQSKKHRPTVYITECSQLDSFCADEGDVNDCVSPLQPNINYVINTKIDCTPPYKPKSGGDLGRWVWVGKGYYPTSRAESIRIKCEDDGAIVTGTEKSSEGVTKPNMVRVLGNTIIDGCSFHGKFFKTWGTIRNSHFVGPYGGVGTVQEGGEVMGVFLNGTIDGATFTGYNGVNKDGTIAWALGVYGDCNCGVDCECDYNTMITLKNVKIGPGFNGFDDFFGRNGTGVYLDFKTNLHTPTPLEFCGPDRVKIPFKDGFDQFYDNLSGSNSSDVSFTFAEECDWKDDY